MRAWGDGEGEARLSVEAVVWLAILAVLAYALANPDLFHP